MVLLSGCTGSFGIGEEVGLYPINDPSSGTVAARTTAPATTQAVTSTETARSQTETAISPTSSTSPTETAAPSEDDSNSIQDSGDDGGGSSAPADTSNPSSQSTTATAVTTGDTDSPTTTRTVTTQSPTEAATETGTPTTTDDCGRYGDSGQQFCGPEPQVVVEWDDEVELVHGVEHNELWIGAVHNRMDRPIEHLHVSLVAYDAEGNVLSKRTYCLTDVPANGSGGLDDTEDRYWTVPYSTAKVDHYGVAVEGYTWESVPD